METFKKLLMNYLDEKIEEAVFLAKNQISIEDKSKYKAVMRAYMKVRMFIENYQN